MSTARKPARDVAQIRSEHEVWIDQAKLEDSDVEWLQTVRWLTLWNVTTPPGFLATLPMLEALDIRGGTATDLSVLDGCDGLRLLIVNQIRGLSDLSVIESLTNLEYLQLYGLKQVVEAPSLASLEALVRMEVGQMKGLPELGGLLDAPSLDVLELLKDTTVSDADVERIQSHPTLSAFAWWAMDVPKARSAPVIEAINLPLPQSLDSRKWFEQNGGLL